MNKKKLLILITALAVLSTGCVVRNRIKKVINKIEENESTNGESLINDIMDNDNSNKEVSLDVKKDGKVAVYLFRGEGCPHCEEAMEWFNSIKEDYGNLYVLIDYETWYNEENASLMSKVAESRGDSGMGVPYIVIGDNSWEGFTDSYKEEIINQIKKVSEK